MKSRRRSAPRHAQIHLPPLDPSYALSLVDILEHAIAAIWRAHGEPMAQLLRDKNHRGPEPLPIDDQYVEDGNPHVQDDIPF